MLLEYTLSDGSARARLSLRPEATSLMLGDEQVLSFDGEGRLLTAFRGGRLYKRGFDLRVMSKWRPWHVGRPEFIRRDLGDDEKRELIDAVQSTLREALAALPASAPGARARLERAASWDMPAYLADRARFERAYRPVPILPPDQYLALVLQATEGCHYNRCAFCDFYRGRPFHIKSAAEFAEHIRVVREFLGAGARLRRTIFLADANALVIPTERLLGLLDTVGQEFEIAPAGLRAGELPRWKSAHPEGIAGIYSFVDAFTGRRKSREEFAELAARGLRRVYIGMESGHAPLLAFLRKPSMPEDVRATARAAKAAGVAVGVIVMLGIGGERYAQGHVDDTVAVVNSLGLGADDIVYFSEFVEEPGTEYAALAAAAGIRALTGGEVRAQAAAIRAGLRFASPPKLATYDIREFIY